MGGRDRVLASILFFDPFGWPDSSTGRSGVLRRIESTHEEPYESSTGEVRCTQKDLSLRKINPMNPPLVMCTQEN